MLSVNSACTGAGSMGCASSACCDSCDSGDSCNGCGASWWGSRSWGGGARLARNLTSQLRALYNTRIHITTFTCTLDVVLLDVGCEFIRVLDYCTGKIFLLRIDCICMIEQPIVPGC